MFTTYRPDNYVQDKVIVITGASSGFGAATARKAAAMGGKVVLAARREERLEKITNEIKAAGGQAAYIKTDVCYKDQVFAMVQFAINTFGSIDVLINNAGTMPESFFADYKISLEAWDQCIDTSIKGTVYGISAAFDPMMDQGYGHIINISSIMGNYGLSGNGVYNVSKVAIKYLSDSLRAEARGKIKVTNIKPTAVNTTELMGTIVNVNGSMAAMYGGKLFETMAITEETCPGIHDRDSVQLSEPTADDLADNIIYAINQPWGVDISDITVRASGEHLFV